VARVQVRGKVVEWAVWGIANRAGFTYDEVRPMPSIANAAGTVPWIGDCSAWVTQCFKWAGCPDPNGLDYDGLGFTGTLVAHGTEIPLSEVRAGDVIVYGPGSGVHAAVILLGGADPLTSSMGQQGCPCAVRVSQDGRLPQRYFRFDTTAPGVLQPPPVGKRPKLPPQPHGPLPLLYRGVRGEEPWIRFLHRLLGLPRPFLGGYGVLTERKVRQFQTAHKLPATGVWGAPEWDHAGVRPIP
jgi:peptidoglycan hydrolase-like protein with peptidoglycan-binding domain